MARFSFEEFRSSRLGLPLALLALLLLLWMLWRSDDSSQNNSETGNPLESGQPTSFLTDARFRSFDENGQPASQLTSPRVEQFQDRDLAVLEFPRARLTGKPTDADQSLDNAWQIEANQGTYHLEKELIELEGDVVAIRPLANGGQATLETSRLNVDNRQRIAFTDAPATMTDQVSVIHTTGFKAWMDSRVVELNSDVEGIYEPKR